MEALLHKSAYVNKVILSKKANRNAQLDDLLSLCEKHQIPYEYDDLTIDKLSVKENCYCIGFFDKFYDPLQSEDHIVLYGFDDYGELGTILRSAIAFNCTDIVLVNSDIDYFDPRCIRASMGSIFQCNIVTYEDLQAYEKVYLNQHIYPFVSKGTTEVSDLFLSSPYSLIIPQEEKGLDGLYENGIYIDHEGDQGISLSIRSSIILEHVYDLKRRR